MPTLPPVEEIVREIKAAPAAERPELVRRSGRMRDIAAWIEAQELAEKIAVTPVPAPQPGPP